MPPGGQRTEVTQSETSHTTSQSGGAAGRDAVDLLQVYVGDHWAGAGAGAALAKRLVSSNKDSPWYETLHRIMVAIEADQAALARVREALGSSGFSVKRVLARTAEYVGRFKLNGRLIGYSPLSRVLELEALIAGVQAKRQLWSALQRVGAERGRLGGLGDVELQDLERRADEQLTQLIAIHGEAAAIAFA